MGTESGYHGKMMGNSDSMDGLIFFFFRNHGFAQSISVIVGG